MSFLPLTRNEIVNDKLLEDSGEGFAKLTKTDKTPSFSYSFTRISKASSQLSFRENDESVKCNTNEKEEDGSFTTLERALSFAHKGVGIASDSAASTKTSVLPPSANMLKSSKIVGVVDTFSTGALIVDSLIRQGFGVIRILSGELNPDLLDMVLAGLSTAYITTVTFNTKLSHADSLEELVSSLRNVDVNGTPAIDIMEAIIAGAETGVELADALSERLGLMTNGTAMSEARRNKYIMGETVRNAGIRAVKQLQASNWSEVDEFLTAWSPSPFKVIVKPLDSAGSDGVTLCQSADEVHKAFHHLLGKVNGLGFMNSNILIQEYLEGQEYVIDIVSRDGEHKVMAVWEYDRRAVNGASFICFGQRILTADEPRCQELINYQKRVITALGIKHGPTHGEVKWFQGEPVLVEVGARCHGGEGAWCDVATEVFGYNQAEATIMSYLKPEDFAALPSLPLQRKAYGYMKWIVVTESVGKLSSIKPEAVSEITSMESYRGHQFFVSPGDTIRPTVDCFTWAGCIKLVHKYADHASRDYDRLAELETRDLFDVEEK